MARLVRCAPTTTASNALVRRGIGQTLGLLHELAPKANRIAVLTNPAVASTAESTLRKVREAASRLGLQVVSFEAASTRRTLVAAPLGGSCYESAQQFSRDLPRFGNRRKASSRSDGPSGPRSAAGLATRDNRHAQPFGQSDLQLLEPPEAMYDHVPGHLTSAEVAAWQFDAPQ